MIGAARSPITALIGRALLAFIVEINSAINAVVLPNMITAGKSIL